MKLSKAREILEMNVGKVGTRMPPETLEALKMGIAALARVERHRQMNIPGSKAQLPGETEE